MKAIIKTRKFDINLKSPFATYYTAIAESEERVIEMLQEELSKDNAYTVDDFEIEDCGKATDQMGRYFEERFTNEME
jgi:hypothetical protein